MKDCMRKPNGEVVRHPLSGKEAHMPRQQHRTAGRSAIAEVKAKGVTVRDVMTKDVTTLHRNETLDVAEGLMFLSSIRHVPIVDDDGSVVGMLSNRDMFRSALAFAIGYGDKGRTAMQRTIRVKEVMVEPVITIGPGASMAEAARIMVEKKIGCLPVVEGGKLAGIITETDILRQACLKQG
jgi:CBS domain-containing protein